MTPRATDDDSEQTPDASDDALDSLLRHVARGGAVAAARALPQVGETIDGKYKIEGLVGRGGMGAVFRASHVVTGKSVALKWLLRTGDDERARRHFLREALAAARIEHPNVVDLYDVGESEQGEYLVMPLLRGETLRARLRRGRLSVDEAMRLMLPVLRGTAAMHRAGVIHRDLKPDNIFLCQGDHDEVGEVKVLDFGISAITSAEPLGPTLTLDAAVVGTPAYMAPECFRSSHRADERADVYSLGVILYEALTGRLPFDADSYPSMILAVNQERPKPLYALQPELPRSLSRIVLRAVQSNLDERYPSVERLLEALESHALGRGPTAVGKKRLLVGALLAGVVAASVGAYRLRMPSARSPEGSVQAAPSTGPTRDSASGGSAFEPRAPYLSGADCEACLAHGCSTESAACQADPDCSQLLARARSASSPLIADVGYLRRVADNNWSYDRGERPGKPPRAQLTWCARKKCQSACGIGRNFSCTGKFDWPDPEERALQLRSRFLPLEDPSLAYAQWNVKACRRSPVCGRVMGAAKTDARGFAVLNIDLGNVRPNTERWTPFDGVIETEAGAGFFKQAFLQSGPYTNGWYSRFFVATREEIRATHAARGLPIADATRGLLEIQPQDCDYWLAWGLTAEIWRLRLSGYELCDDCTVVYPDAAGTPDPTLTAFGANGRSQAEVALAPGEVLVILREQETGRVVSALPRVTVATDTEVSVSLFPASREQLDVLPAAVRSPRPRKVESAD